MYYSLLWLIAQRIITGITEWSIDMVFVEASMAVLGASTEVSRLTVEIMEVSAGAYGTAIVTELKVNNFTLP